MIPLWALFKKELLEIAGERHALRGSLVQFAVFVLVVGVFVPASSLSSFLANDPSCALFYLWLPGIMSASIASDAFAGERERHTLETLLATPLSEGVILSGKLAAAMAFGMAMASAGLLFSFATVRVLAGAYVPSLPLVAVSLGASLASSLMTSSMAIVVSMRTPVVRVAYQTSWLCSMGVFGLAVAAWKWAALPLSWTNLAIAEAILIALGLVVLGVGRVLFRRARFFESA